MKAIASISFGTEIDVEHARKYTKWALGSEYREDMTDEECVKYYATEKYNKGIGCEVTVEQFIR